MKALFIFVMTILLVSCSQDTNNNKSTHKAKIKAQALEYKHGDTPLQGYLAYDESISGKRPAVLIVHAWKGLGNFEKKVARKLAKMGYVAFALDMYGKGVRAKDSKEAKKLSSTFRKDIALMQSRANAGLAALKKHPLVQDDKVAGIGYCFGGNTILELARSGVDMIGVVSFHGNLKTPHPDKANNIKGKILILHGADDPNVPPEEVFNFQHEMRMARVDWQFVMYGGAKHAFTNPKANSKTAKYHKKADKRSWKDMKQFFNEIF